MALVCAILLAFVVAATAGCDACSCTEAYPVGVFELGILEDTLTADVAQASEPGVEVLGLRLGVPDPDAARVWLASLGIPCSEGIDEERSLSVTECRDIDGQIRFTLRPFGGEVARVIMEQTFDSAVVSISVRRRHPAVTAGYSDYGPTSAAIATELGAGYVSGGFDLQADGTEPSRETMSWSNERFSVEVEILRGMGPVVMVTETWRWLGNR